MIPSIPSRRPFFSPARISTAIAAIAVSGNLYLMIGDARASQAGAFTAPLVTACAEALRARYPGELGVEYDLASRMPQ